MLLSLLKHKCTLCPTETAIQRLIYLSERALDSSLALCLTLAILAFFCPANPPFPSFFLAWGGGVFSIRFHSILSETEHMLSSGGPWCVCRLEDVVCTHRVLWQRTECLFERCVPLHLRLVSAADRDKWQHSEMTCCLLILTGWAVWNDTHIHTHSHFDFSLLLSVWRQHRGLGFYVFAWMEKHFIQN